MKLKLNTLYRQSEAAARIAVNALKRGLSPEEIHELTGLSPDEIHKMKAGG